MKISSQRRNGGWPGALRVAALALALQVGGCATAPKTAGPVTLKISGDPGVSVQVISSLPNVPPQAANVPAELPFHGANYELRCVHGTQPGRLKIIAARGGLEISTGDTTQPGQVVVFKIRPNEIAAGPEAPAK
jgi:hypothetical protein